MKKKSSSFSWRRLWLGVAGFAIIAAGWEAFAVSGVFSQALAPPLGKIFETLFHLLAHGDILKHTLYTLLRVLVGLTLACVIGIPLGMLMGRVRAVERFFLPLVSVLMPIPSLAWVPLFILWFGLGNITTVLVVLYASSYPVIYNVWTGVRGVNPLWLKAGAAMGADRRALFWKVVLPGSLPFVFSGIRLAFGRAWIAVIGGELLAGTVWGLGTLIFDAQEFLQTSTMLVALIFIGVIGLAVERLVFQRIEEITVARWGMIAGARR
jgi:NitT/TauT family transport system permease protein